MKIGIVCYPTFGGSGIVATELGKALADKGHEVHFVAYRQPVRLNDQVNNIVCLLYTSPSPRDRTRSRMPSSA